eukprot:5679389-Prymnesium_polylepis.2
MIGFALAFIGLTQWHDNHREYGVGTERMLKDSTSDSGAEEQADREGPWTSVSAAFWATFGEVDLEFFEAEVPLGQPVLYAYVLVSSIVLVNLLVAMGNSELEYRFQQCNSFFLYDKAVLLVPPPFNLPFVLPDLIATWCPWCLGRNGWLALEEKSPADMSTANGNEIALQYVEPYLRAKEQESEDTMHAVVKSGWPAGKLRCRQCKTTVSTCLRTSHFPSKASTPHPRPPPPMGLDRI